MARIIAFVLAGATLLADPGHSQEPKPPMLTPEEQKLVAEATSINDEAGRAWRAGKYSEAVALSRRSLEMLRQVYPAEKYPDGHHYLATSLNNVGVMLQAMGLLDQALSYAEQSLAMRRKLFPPAKYPNGHSELAGSLNNVGFLLRAMGSPAKALPYYEQALAMKRKLYPEAQFPNGDPDLAQSLNNLSVLLQALSLHERALPLCEQSLAMRRKLYPAAKYPDGHLDLAQSLNNLGSLLRDMGSYEKALPFEEQALAMRQRLFPKSKYPNGHPELLVGVVNLGVLRKEMGAVEYALPLFEQSLVMLRQLYPAKKYPNGHRDLARMLGNFGVLMEAMGSWEAALPYHEQALAMWRTLYPTTKYPDGHPDLARGLNNLGVVLKVMGSFEKAVSYLESALAMWKQLYPAGHPEHANGLINLGSAHQAMDSYAKALPYFERAMAMTLALYPVAQYPDGHPRLALSFNNFGHLLQQMRSYPKAKEYYERALEMHRRLFPESKYPHGHPAIATSLNNLGVLIQKSGSAATALPYYEQTLALRQKLFPAEKYPDGHPDLAQILSNLGFVLYELGSQEQASAYFEKALAMTRNLRRRLLANTSESESLAFVQAQPLTRDAFLSLTRRAAGSADAAYTAVWESKSAVTRVQEHRLAAARLAGTPHAAQLHQLKALRRRLDRLLRDPRIPTAERDRLLASTADERDGLERELAKALPLLRRANGRDGESPDALVTALPERTVFIDFVRYVRFEYERANAGEPREIRSPCYAAFVLAPGRAIRRIELGEASPIDAAIREWRTAITSRMESLAVKQLTQRVWQPIAKALPNGTRTLYLAPDGDLARLPWAALPVGRERVLLEEFALAQVPHGLFLLDQLRPRRSDEGDSLFALGGVEYGPGIWPALAGTRIEITAITSIAPGARDTVDGANATAAKVVESLTKARYAHLATHGEFKADELTAEQKRAAAAIEAQSRGDDSRKIAAKNPLGYVGLVLSGGEILSGLKIIDLKLDQLKLVTLSACETGLGELTGGEGVQGLQRAFHLAGCPNVVASLWKINDAATAALMARFYHELWVNKKPPIEALREAQLTIYHHPELIPDLAGERGAPKFDAAVKTAQAEPTDRKRADTRLWAAFVLSGVGK